MSARHRETFWRKHSLSLIACSVLLVWTALYLVSSPDSHWGSFFGNAIADWTGLVVMVLATKRMYETGSAQSKQPSPAWLPHRLGFLREHSLTMFFLITGAAWVALFKHVEPMSKWGQVVGNIVSEWTQILGLVLLTKRLRESGSQDSK